MMPRACTEKYSGIEDIKNMLLRENNQLIEERIKDIKHIFDGNDTQLLEDGNRVSTVRTIKKPGSYKAKLVFKHVEFRIIVTRGPLLTAICQSSCLGMSSDRKEG